MESIYNRGYSNYMGFLGQINCSVVIAPDMIKYWAA